MELHRKSAVQYSPKELRKLGTCFKTLKNNNKNMKYVHLFHWPKKNGFKLLFPLLIAQLSSHTITLLKSWTYSNLSRLIKPKQMTSLTESYFVLAPCCQFTRFQTALSCKSTYLPIFLSWKFNFNLMSSPVYSKVCFFFLLLHLNVQPWVCREMAIFIFI